MESVRRACFARKDCQALDLQEGTEHQSRWNCICHKCGRGYVESVEEQTKVAVSAVGRMRSGLEKASGKLEIELCWRQR